MGWTEKYAEDEIVFDWTKSLSKVWDNLMPEVYPFVLKFETHKAVEVHHRMQMGPYHMDEQFIDYDCSVEVDGKPLFDAGWNGKDQITKKLADQAYGENYFFNMRHKLVELSPYAGLKFSNFDMGGDLKVTVEDLN